VALPLVSGGAPSTMWWYQHWRADHSDLSVAVPVVLPPFHSLQGTVSPSLHARSITICYIADSDVASSERVLPES
jgi:hypothetical protein